MQNVGDSPNCEVLKQLYGTGKPAAFVGMATLIAAFAGECDEMVEGFVLKDKPPNTTGGGRSDSANFTPV